MLNVALPLLRLFALYFTRQGGAYFHLLHLSSTETLAQVDFCRTALLSFSHLIDVVSGRGFNSVC
jgi:hypothetical protein